MPATRRLASRIASFRRVLLVKSSRAFTPSTLLLLGIKCFGPLSVAGQAPRSAQHSIISSAYRGAQRLRQQNPAGRASRSPNGILQSQALATTATSLTDDGTTFTHSVRPDIFLGHNAGSVGLVKGARSAVDSFYP